MKFLPLSWSDIYDFDIFSSWDLVKDDYRNMDKKLLEVEREIGLLRGNYKGW